MLVIYGVIIVGAVIVVGISDLNKLTFWDWSAQAWSAAFTAAVGFGLLFFGWVSLKAQKQHTH